MKKCNFYITHNGIYSSSATSGELANAAHIGPLDLPEYLQLVVNAEFKSRRDADFLFYMALVGVLSYFSEMTVLVSGAVALLMLCSANFVLTCFSAALLSRSIAKNRESFLKESLWKNCAKTITVAEAKFTLSGVIRLLSKSGGYFSTISAIKQARMTESYCIVPNEDEAVFLIGPADSTIHNVMHSFNASKDIFISRKLQAMNENNNRKIIEPLFDF